MKLCTKHGCGVCIHCDRNPGKDGDICRKTAEEMLDAFRNIIDYTDLSEEQTDILREYEISF